MPGRRRSGDGVRAAVAGEAAIYSALFLAASAEEPDSRLMTATRRASARPGSGVLGAAAPVLKVVASEKASPWEAALLEEGTGPCHPDPQGKCPGSNHSPFFVC